MTSLIQDLSTLTMIPELSLKKLAEKSKFIICHDVCETIASKKEETQIDIGIGTIAIFIDNDCLRYRFAPSPSLENALRNSVLEGENPLSCEIENALVNRIENTYKELF